MNDIRAIVKFSEELQAYEATILELNLVAVVADLNSLVTEVEYLLVLEYTAATENGLTPFAHLVRTEPSPLEFQWKAHRRSSSTHAMCLPDAVAQALRIALRADQLPTITTTELKAA